MFFKAFNEHTRSIFNTDLDKHNILSWIIYNTNYSPKEYRGLNLHQCYISSSIISKSTNINISKVKRILKNLEEEKYFDYYFKSNGGIKKPSIINVNYRRWCEANYELINKLDNELDYKLSSSIENTNKIVYLKERVNPVKGQDNDHLSKNKYKELYNDIMEAFNIKCYKLDKVKLITEKRKLLINELLEEIENDIGIIYEVFDNVSESSFLNGINDKNWKANFDWIINIENFVKILEGKYQMNYGQSNINTKNSNIQYDKNGYEII